MRIKQEDAKKFKRILAIGDIHGEFKKLVNLWNQIHFNPKEDLVIFLGDYTDRGPDSVKCTRFIREVAKIDNVITLMGNHEQMMLYYLENNSLDDIINHPERLDNWLLNGGNVTINDFKDKGINEIYEWFHFVNTMPMFVDIGDMLFCHAGINPDRRLNDQTAEDMLWIREKFYNNYQGDKMIIVGHTPVQYLIDTDDIYVPLYIEDRNILMCDTGAFMENVGRLSCINVLDMNEIYSVGDNS